MTIGGWVGFAFIAVFVAIVAICIAVGVNSKGGAIAVILAGVIIIAAAFFGLRWYFNNTASGQRALVDQRSELSNGLERTITVYTADGKVIAQYTGEIDIEGNDGGYVLFDFEGKRYTYYNCFVESVAVIESE